MLKVILRNLFSKPVTERYPYVQREHVKGARGRIAIDIKSCIFCGMCQRKCPTAALKVEREKKIWEIDRLSCITCNYCVEVCPKKCLKMETSYSPCVIKPGKEVHQNA